MGLTSKEKEKENLAHDMVNPEKMADERTPLITTVVTAPPRQRYPHHVLRRFCTIALSCSLIALFATFLFDFGFSDPPQSHGHDWAFSWPGCKGRTLSYEELKQILLDTPSSEKAEEWQRYYTAGAHLAGQNYSQVGTFIHFVNFRGSHADNKSRHCGQKRSGSNGVLSLPS